MRKRTPYNECAIRSANYNLRYVRLVIITAYNWSEKYAIYYYHYYVQLKYKIITEANLHYVSHKTNFIQIY